MQIKDVEKLTGLTQKSIRYYESKGLLSVKRDRRNDYREYTEEDVEVLRTIRLYRFLDFSVEEIRTLLEAEPEERKAMLQNKVDSFEKQRIENDIKKDLCLSLMKSGDCSALWDDLETLDGELEQAANALLELSYTNVYAVIVSSLILLGPILWLFLNISERKWELLPWNAVLSMIASVLLWNTWRDFAKFRRSHKAQLQQENKKNRLVLPAILVCLAASFAFICGMQVFQQKLLPGDYLFFESPPALLILPITILIFTVALILTRVLQRKSIRSMGLFDVLSDWLRGKKSVLFGILAAVLLSVYCVCTTVNGVTEDKILVCRPWNPGGTSYSYNQLESVDAHFRRNGDFRYTLQLSGVRIRFSVPDVNPEITRYAEDSYLELEEFDEKLMQLGIPKTGDESFSGRAHLDQVYIDRFLRIVNNEPSEL